MRRFHQKKPVHHGNAVARLAVALLLFHLGDESLEDVSLPSGARALDLSFFSDAVPSTNNFLVEMVLDRDH